MFDIQKLEDGVYFDIPHQDYIDLPCLTNSGIKDLVVNPADFWGKRNGWIEQKETDALSFGTMAHMALLEGWEKFESNYVVKPDDIKFNTKAGKEWKENFPSYANFVKEKDFQAVKRAHKIIQAVPDYRKYFEVGNPEVTIIWTEKVNDQEIKCGARFDYLQNAGICDLKTFSNSISKPTSEAVSKSFADNKYYTQAYWYLRGLKALQDKGLLEKIENKFTFIFLESSGVPNIMIRQFTRDTNGMINAYYKLGEMYCLKGLEIYANMMKRFGPDKPWILVNQERPFIDDEFPVYMYPKDL